MRHLQSRVLQATAKYSEAAPMATTCCNACRTCATTNIATLALGAVVAAGAGIARFGKRHAFWLNHAPAWRSR
jgi:hypothetical protein